MTSLRGRAAEAGRKWFRSVLETQFLGRGESMKLFSSAFVDYM